MHLFSPLSIGRARLPNRIALAALQSGYATPDGFANDALHMYYRERAQGGAGLLIFEPAYVLPPTHTPVAHLGLYNDAFVSALHQCVASVHKHGAVALLTLDQPLPAAQLDACDLKALCDAWVTAAWRARAVGADGIMLSCADGGPFDQLLSPSINQRTDEYGGDSTRRMRLLLDVIEQIIAWMGRRLLIGVKINVGEFTSGGLSLQDARVIAKRLVGAGVGFIEVSAEVDGTHAVARFPGWRVPLASSIKAIIDVPVMVGGLLADAELADSVVHDGSADLVALGESLRLEPRWPQYARMVLGQPPAQP